MNNHFNSKISPLGSIIIAYFYIFILVTIFWSLNLYEKSNFFNYGIPVVFMGKDIDDYFTYYILLLLFFIHQLINNLVNEITYPWIINCVQDPKSKSLIYSQHTSLIIINLFSLYSQLDVILILAGIMSQITFFIAIILANMISLSVINWHYIKKHNKDNFIYHYYTEL